jgi:hypothetical protein
MHLALLLLLLSYPEVSVSAPASPPTAQKDSRGEVAEIIVPKACVQRIECKGEWHLKNKMWSCPSLTVAFNCYRPKVEKFAPSERH